MFAHPIYDKIKFNGCLCISQSGYKNDTDRNYIKKNCNYNLLFRDLILVIFIWEMYYAHKLWARIFSNYDRLTVKYKIMDKLHMRIECIDVYFKMPKIQNLKLDLKFTYFSKNVIHTYRSKKKRNKKKKRLSLQVSHRDYIFFRANKVKPKRVE